MSTKVSVFFEYEGPIPVFPFDYVVDRASEPIPGNHPETSKEIFRTNVKVFEKDVSKRKKIIEVAIATGLKLEADCIVTVMPDKTRIIAYDRLIFSYVKPMEKSFAEISLEERRNKENFPLRM